MARAYAKGDEAPSAEDAVESFVNALLDFLGRDELRSPHPPGGTRLMEEASGDESVEEVRSSSQELVPTPLSES